MATTTKKKSAVRKTKLKTKTKTKTKTKSTRKSPASKRGVNARFPWKEHRSAAATFALDGPAFLATKGNCVLLRASQLSTFTSLP